MALDPLINSRRTTLTALGASVLGVAAVALIAAIASTLGPTGAGAEPVNRPIPTADTFAAYAGGTYTIDVLANDTTSFMSQGPLSLCGVTVSDQVGRSVFAAIDETDPNLVYIETNRTSDGTVQFSYDACQGSQRKTSTVTLTVSRPQPLVVEKKKNRPGKLVVSNPNAGSVMVLWGSDRTATSDGKRSVPGTGSIIIDVDRPRIAWLGYLSDDGATIIVGDGTVTGIEQPTN